MVDLGDIALPFYWERGSPEIEIQHKEERGKKENRDRL